MATDSALWRLLQAISRHDHAVVSRQLAADSRLATAVMLTGATRVTSTPYFLDAIQHYVYAGDTALHVAAATYAAAFVKRLLREGASVNSCNRRGAQPLHYASVGQPGSAGWAPQAQADVIALLLDSGADPNAADKSGVWPLHLAVRTRCAAAVRVLLAHGADPQAENGRGSTPLHLAVQNTGRGGSSTLAARTQQAEIIQLLIAHGAQRAG